MNRMQRALAIFALAAAPMAGSVPGCAMGYRGEQNARIRESFKIADGAINWAAYNTYFRGIDGAKIPVGDAIKHHGFNRRMYGYVSIHEGTQPGEVLFTVIRGQGKSALRWEILAADRDAINIVDHFLALGSLHKTHDAYEDAEDVIDGLRQSSPAPSP